MRVDPGGSPLSTPSRSRTMMYVLPKSSALARSSASCPVTSANRPAEAACSPTPNKRLEPPTSYKDLSRSLISLLLAIAQCFPPRRPARQSRSTKASETLGQLHFRHREHDEHVHHDAARHLHLLQRPHNVRGAVGRERHESRTRRSRLWCSASRRAGTFRHGFRVLFLSICPPPRTESKTSGFSVLDAIMVSPDTRSRRAEMRLSTPMPSCGINGPNSPPRYGGGGKSNVITGSRHYHTRHRQEAEE